MARFFLVAGAVALALAVAMGAMSAHAARSAVHPEATRLLQTAVLYQFVHSLGLVAVAILARASVSRWLLAAGSFHLAGILGFCGGIYLLAFTGSSMGSLVPLGGTAFIVGWLNLAGFALFEKR